MNLELAINSAYQKLKKNNIKSAMLDSEILMSEAVNKSREFVILNNNLPIDEKDYKFFSKNDRSKIQRQTSCILN